MEKKASYVVLILSIIAIILAIIGAAGQDIWLASTQWMIIAAVLAIYSLYFKK